MAAEMNPRIIPSRRNGPLTNQSVAPRYFIIPISFDLLKTVSFMVLATMITDTTIRNTITTTDDTPFPGTMKYSPDDPNTVYVFEDTDGDSIPDTWNRSPVAWEDIDGDGLLEAGIARNGDGEIDCTGDRLQIRINCVAFIIIESLLKGSDKGMTPSEYEEYRIEQTKQTNQTYTSESALI